MLEGHERLPSYMLRHITKETATSRKRLLVRCRRAGAVILRWTSNEKLYTKGYVLRR